MLILVCNGDTVRVLCPFYQERNAESAIEALKAYASEEASVLRAGHHGLVKIKASELVPGDIVEVAGMTRKTVWYTTTAKS